MNFKALMKLLEKDGWYNFRQKGSHIQLKHPTKPGKVTVPFKGSGDIPKGTLGSILRQAGLK
jgi:predicted RNA binding protein YcfA (HicA-like mRNA interferase family)